MSHNFYSNNSSKIMLNEDILNEIVNQDYEAITKKLKNF